MRAGGDGSAETVTVSATLRVIVMALPSAPVTVTSPSPVAVMTPFRPGSRPESLR